MSFILFPQGLMSQPVKKNVSERVAGLFSGNRQTSPVLLPVSSGRKYMRPASL
jgi:hypothetical protein